MQQMGDFRERLLIAVLDSGEQQGDLMGFRQRHISQGLSIMAWLESGARGLTPISSVFRLYLLETIHSMNSKNIRFVTFLCACIASLLGNQRANASILLTWFPASGYNANPAIMDATFGITGYLVDSFETTALIPGLTITLSGNIPSPTTWTVLPSLFSPNTQGDGNETNNQWDGSDVVDNGANNQL